MIKKTPILLIVNDRPYLLPLVLNRLLEYTDWDIFELWILENYSSNPVKKIISAFKNSYPFINIFSQSINQISVIQNTIISKLKREIYIKLDDDILVTENWTSGFMNVITRNSEDISIGSSVIPINGFGWKIFLDKMGLVELFRGKFPDIPIIQGCTEPAVWNNPKVVEFIWENSINMDEKAREFIASHENSFVDFEVPFRYSIGAISFTHQFWEKMGGWRVDSGFSKRKRFFNLLNSLNKTLASVRKRPEQKRISSIIDIITKMNVSPLGVEEEYLFKFSQENELKQYVTTESIVYHFSFFTTEEHLVKNILLRLI